MMPTHTRAAKMAVDRRRWRRSAGRASTLAVLLLLGACSTGGDYGPAWQQVSAEQVPATPNNQAYQLRLPVGWMRFRPASREPGAVIAMPDGPYLTWMEFNQREHDKAFKQSEQASTADMPLSEVAERMIADIQQELGLEHMAVLQNQLSRINGRPMFDVLLESRNAQGLRYRLRAVGYVDERGLWYAAMLAPALYYFPRDLPAFDAALQSWQPNPPQDNGKRS